MQVIDLCTTLGLQLRSARRACHLTQQQLSARAHVSSREISKIENGVMNPSYEILHALICALDISADVLFYPDRPENDSRFQRLVSCYQKCPEEKREDLVKTMQFIVENLLCD